MDVEDRHRSDNLILRIEKVRHLAPSACFDTRRSRSEFAAHPAVATRLLFLHRANQITSSTIHKTIQAAPETANPKRS